MAFKVRLEIKDVETAHRFVRRLLVHRVVSSSGGYKASKAVGFQRSKRVEVVLWFFLYKPHSLKELCLVWSFPHILYLLFLSPFSSFLCPSSPS